jgi:hypothetical protein
MKYQNGSEIFDLLFTADVLVTSMQAHVWASDRLKNIDTSSTHRGPFRRGHRWKRPREMHRVIGSTFDWLLDLKNLSTWT